DYHCSSYAGGNSGLF
nr:immunoglobulin light chain junction region [Macaca mulatta]MOW02148.1 immunoglobulin light chain junction region [Macaca mulatta]MOW02229.1 immunoglobulin light chain junction region [Macaca mulatta]MOW02250.1 immunoglobulin light chain junction region [Macaca mulatta]MOW02253.1 immunoglobulin light chain junction region [Macaca mulatta]